MLSVPRIGSNHILSITSGFGRITRSLARQHGLLKQRSPNLQNIRGCFHPGASSQIIVKNEQALSSTQLVKKLLQFAWPKDNPSLRKRVVLAFGLLVTAKVLNAFVPFIFRDIVNLYNNQAPEFLKLSVDSPVSAIAGVGVSLIIAYGIARASSAGFNELRNAVFAKVAQGSVRTISRRIFLHLHSLDLSFHLNRQTGALSKAIDRGTRGMSFVMSALIFNVLPTMVEVGLVSAIFAKTLGPEFTVATLTCVSLYAGSTLAVTRWRTKFRHDMNRADNEAGNKAIDSLINYETVKYFNNEKFEAERYDLLLKDFEKASLKTSSSLALLNFTQNTIFSMGLVTVMCLAANKIATGELSVGDLVLANTLLFQLSLPLNFLGSVYREVRQGLVDMNSMFSLLKLKPKIVNAPNAKELEIAGDDIAIKFDNIKFGYQKEKSILNGLSMDIPRGKKVAIVGGSGSGKSTIIRLLYRLYDADEGKITINGHNTQKLTLESLRRNIAVVPQDSVLFHDSIYYNIAYGNPLASKEEVEGAARMADVHNSVLSMPNGYSTIVGERGLKLSGGEKQRVAIARAILKDCPLVVFDEATSSLDALTEATIMRSLKAATGEKTSLFVAHRLSTIKDADIIYVLEDGKVAEKGTHAQLLTKEDSLYSKMWQSQHSKEGLNVVEKKEKNADAMELLILDEDKCCGSSSCNR
uniref:Iron-sulfur clusters transporter ABCB7, mitochondrial n=1 Tax=Pristionchus pacificus TaxID=54126 RepID=A0A8R1YXL0_PRIPA